MGIYSRSLSWVMAIAVSAYLAFAVVAGWDPLSRVWPGLVFLALAAMLTSGQACGTANRPPLRLSLTFVLAALLLLPSPAGLLVATLAGLAGQGAGVAGLHRRGVHTFAALVASVAVAETVVTLSGAAAQATTVTGLGWMILIYSFIQGLTVGLARLAGEDAPSSGIRHALGLEILNVVAAWLLAVLWARGHWSHVAALAMLTIVSEATLVQLAAALRALRRSNRELASRITELDTLHAIGGEIVSSLDPGRVFAIIDRECRKIFDVDSCVIALVDLDSSGLRVVYHHRRGFQPRTDERPFAEGPAGWVLDHKRGLRIDDLRDPELAAHLRQALLDRGMRSLMVVPLVVEGTVVGVLSVRSRAPQAYGDHQLSVLTTIAQQAAVAIENAKHYQMATVDSLTGFFLRDYFFRRLDEEYTRVTRYGGRFTLLMLDLDGFKSINDRHGHLVGDRFLQGVTHTIRLQLRAADLACRYGGDEFCLLLPETSAEGGRAIAERIREAIAESEIDSDGLSLRTTASIGIAVFPEHDSGSINRLLHNADEALYRAKRAGRDCVVPYAA